MDTFNPGIDILMVDLDGTKLEDEQLGDKVVTVAKVGYLVQNVLFESTKPRSRTLKKLVHW